MENLPSLSISRLLCIVLLTIPCCSSDDAYNDLVNGQIAYPFYSQNNPIGKESKNDNDRFTIRTISGNSEYVVEIPGAADEFDVEVPIASSEDTEQSRYKVKNAQLTDKELVAAMPQLSKATDAERALMDKAYGVGERGGPSQSPSYTLKIDKINKLYQLGKFELALIEVNNLMAYYPTSVKLYKMKGSILIKLTDYSLAEKAWARALDLSPNDVVIKKGLARLRRRAENADNEKTKFDENASLESPASEVPVIKATLVEPAQPAKNAGDKK